MKGRKSSSYSIGNVRVKVVGCFNPKIAFEKDEEINSLLTDDAEKKIDRIVKRVSKGLKKTDKFFRLQMGNDTSMFHGDKRSDDYTQNLNELLHRFFNTLESSDIGPKIKKLPPIKILSFSTRRKTMKHAKAVSFKGKKVRAKGLAKMLKAGIDRKRAWRENKRINDERDFRRRSRAAKKGWKTRRLNKQVPF
jgi:hypothetical protein